MQNPYKEISADIEVHVSRRAAAISIFIFLCIIILPPLYQNIFTLNKSLNSDDNSVWVPVIEIFKKSSENTIGEHLQEYENNLESAEFTDPPRRLVQTLLSKGPLREGSGKTMIGKDGWLFLKTALESLTGYGPIEIEPTSVSQDPRRVHWQSPLTSIERFAEQLNEFGVELVIVSIPVKPMIYPEHLSRSAKDPVIHPDSETFYSYLKKLPNVDVLDLTLPLSKLKSKSKVFLKQDTHWTPEGMEAAAKIIAQYIKSKNWDYRKINLRTGYDENRSSLGDLVESLKTYGKIFDVETVITSPVIGKTVDRESPIILLGDSFTNIYSTDTTLHWGKNAGLADHIALNLGGPLDVIAINGGGATEARKKLASRRGSATLMQKKKVIIWAITARDLFLSSTQAHKARVHWEDVNFDKRKPKESLVSLAEVNARMLSKPKLPNPKSTTYSSLLYGADYEVLKTISGKIETDQNKIAVIHWAYKNRQMLPSSNYKVGEERHLNLVPFDQMKELRTLEQHYDGDLFDFYWDLPEASNETPKKSIIHQENASNSHIIASAGCGLFALILVFVMKLIGKHNK
ncbi:MAG: hypothetical protein ACJ0K4_05215 [Verrucomicrobiales bacterium]|nr:MAG: hypothetical protein EVB09_09375 [Verrucomicrobiaceae bacterium]